MVRKLALAVSFALGTLSVPAHALGLGELDSRSALNQNFSGDINLLSVQPEELDTLRVKLADADAFARAGVERPYYLSLLKFEPALTAKGKPVIRISSEFPIREPFMNFLVEVNWPNGRLLREYTVLLDPPTTTSRRPPQVAPAAQSRTTAPAAPVPQATKPARTGTAPAPASVEPGVSQYGPVKANDTAWSISKQLLPRGVSMEQMMMALLNANPDAFVNGDINRLRRGQILRVPPLAEIEQLSRQQARAAYRAQQDAWLARRNEKLQVESAESGAPAPAPAAAATPDDTNDQLRIATARPEGAGEAGAGDDTATTTSPGDLSERLMVARENAETSRQEAETLRSQVDDLQARLRDMQRLLTLKDDQLAQLQDRVVTEEAVAETPPAEGDAADVILANQVGADAGVAPPVDAAGTEPPADYRISDIPPQVDADRIVLASVADAVAEQPAAVSTEPAPADTQPAPVAAAGEPAAVVAPAPAPVEPAPTAEPATPAATGLGGLVPASVAKTLEQNIVPIAIGGISLLALIGWIATRGRRREVPDEGVLAGTAAAAARVDDTPAEAVDKPSMDAAALTDLPDSSFLDDFSPSEINALQDETGEVDPVSEADVYIAYGRYQQAEELLRQAMDRDPDRLALKHKLLEVHYATRNGERFAALAQEMVDAGQDAADEDAWMRALDMGRELAPKHPLFADVQAPRPRGAAAATAAAAGAAAVDSDTLSLDDLELSELTAAYEDDSSDASELDATTEVSILLDLDEASSLTESPVSQMPASIPLDDLEALDFEMPATDKGEVAAGEVDEASISDTLDLDSMMAEAEAVVDGERSTLSLDSEFSAEELQAQLDELSDLSVLDSELNEPDRDASAGRIGLVVEDVSAKGQSLDQPIVLDEAFDADDGEGAEILKFEEIAATTEGESEDDVTTKLDLARAYVEMGDEDGARSILEEVVAEGNDVQRGDAQQLLARLG